jgi:Tfp pilus assembly PilM family ATPase
MLQRFFSPAAAPGWVAIELDGRMARLVHVRRDPVRPVVEFAEKRPWDPGDHKSLERIAREFGLRRYSCLTLLKPADYQILFVEAPEVQRAELKPALRWRIKDMLDYPVEDAALDLLEVPVGGTGAQRTRQMYAVAAKNETVRANVERFAKAGITLAVVDIPDTAQRNVAALFEAEERAVAALTFDPGGGLITVTFKGELYLTRRLDITADQVVESVGKYRTGSDDSLILEDDDGRSQLFERVLVEMQRSLDACERTYPFFSIGRVLLGSVPDEAGLLEHLAGNLYVPVEALDPTRVMRLPKAAAAWSAPERGQWLKLIGAGLRGEDRRLAA